MGALQEAAASSGSDDRADSHADVEDASDDEGGQQNGALERLWPWCLALALLPLAVSAVALVVDVGGSYLPTGDHAGTELHVRDVGSHPVLVGLYSRADWSHPGPMLFYLLAPFYWLTGGSSIGMNLGALAVNGAALAGMALVARRHGGTPLFLSTLVGGALVVRTLGPDFIHDPQNIFVPTLPFGLMILLAWAMARGDTWALPAGVAVASFLAQTHVGFVPLAVPLLALGAVWLTVSVLRPGAPNRRDRQDHEDPDDQPDQRRRLVRHGAVAVGLLVLLWLPPLVDVVLHAPSNPRNLVDWFRDSGEETHTLTEGWRVVTAQFGWPPEWLTAKRAAFLGESPYQYSAPTPVLLVLVVGAALVLWRRPRPGDRALVATLGVCLVLAVVAVARTLGPLFDYRLRWTWMPAMLALVLVVWAGWRLAAALWGQAAHRVLGTTAAAGLLVMSGVNVVTAARAGTPHPDDTSLVATLMPDVLDELGPPDDGIVVVADPFTPASWYGRAVVLQLERRGYDTRVDPLYEIQFGEHRVYGSGRVQARVVLFGGADVIDQMTEEPDLRLLGQATLPRQAQMDRASEQARDLHDDWVAGRISDDAYMDGLYRIRQAEPPEGQSFASTVAVFVDEGGAWALPSSESESESDSESASEEP